MKNITKFNETVNILVKAFLNNTLVSKACTACAVGNIIAHHMGYKVLTQGEFNATPLFNEAWVNKSNNCYIRPSWQNVFMTISDSCQIGIEKVLDKNHFWYNIEADRQISSTGYTWQELAKVEFTFEANQKGMTEEDQMFNGLMAVVDVLAEIHKIDLSVTKEAKEKFVLA